MMKSATIKVPRQKTVLRSRLGTSPPSKGTVPCDHCGGLQLVSWKGGGFKMETSPSSSVDVDPKRNGTKPQLQEHYIAGLLQQIKLLELEIAYLKGGSIPKRQISQEKFSATDHEKEKQDSHQDPGDLRSLRAELSDKSARLEALQAECAQMSSRARALEERAQGERAKWIDQIASLTGKVEHLENEVKVGEERFQATMVDYEKQCIVSKDREKRIIQLSEEFESQQSENQMVLKQLENARTDLIQKERQLTELQEKFLQSSAHIMEETISGLKDDNKRLHQRLVEQEMAVEGERQLRHRLEQLNEKLVTENAEVAASMAEIRQKLESEVRVREQRETKLVLESQDLVIGKERERSLREKVAHLTEELTKEREKLKVSQEKTHRDSQQMTSLELRIATQKSRISELEGSLVLAQENTNKIRKHNLVSQDKINGLLKDLDLKQIEIHSLSSRYATAANKLLESERRCEALATMQSQRWMEFSKMADNMKELSNTMLMQSKTNTKKTNIRNELDEDLDM